MSDKKQPTVQEKLEDIESYLGSLPYVERLADIEAHLRQIRKLLERIVKRMESDDP